MKGLKPHTHSDRISIAASLVPQFQEKFGANLLAIALAASVARNGDRAYSDLELVVFLGEVPAGEDPYLQRIHDGMLIEAIYTTEESYLTMWRALKYSWWQGGSEPLAPLYNAPFLEALLVKRSAYEHPREAYLRRAARQFLEVQESFGKVLNAIDAGNRENLPLLHYAAVMALLGTLAFLNKKPFTTLALYVTEARRFDIKPPRFNYLLDSLGTQPFEDLGSLRALYETLFSGMEALFAAEGYALYDDSIDPNFPNQRYTGRALAPKA